MSRGTPLGLSLAVLAALLSSGCLVPEEGADDAFARAMRTTDGAAAARVPRRGAGWFLVKSWVKSFPADAAAVEGPVPEGDEGLKGIPKTGMRVVLSNPPDAAPASILIRGGHSGFIALARGEPLRRFTLDGRSYGGDGGPADRGFVIVPLAPPGLRAGHGVGLVPAFRGMCGDGEDGGDGGELAARGLSFRVRLGADETLALSAASDASDPLVRALFFDADEDAAAGLRRALWVQVEVFR